MITADNLQKTFPQHFEVKCHLRKWS